MSAPNYAALEVGGTKAVLAFGTGPDCLSDLVRIPTNKPDAMFDAVVDAVKAWTGSPLVGLGIATFGPVALDPSREDWGCILDTPKPGWSGAAIGPELRRRLDLPVAMVTDVVGAALAEGRWGACRDVRAHAYVTVGTGIGVGLVQGGKPLQGMVHPEAGHIPVARDRDRDPFVGSCPFHGDCLEGLASGPAIAARLGFAAEGLWSEDPVWDLIADYLGQLVVTLELTVAPERIVFGGGVGSLPHLLPRIRAAAHRRLNGYLHHLKAPETMLAHIVPPGLDNRSGVLGALLAAADAFATLPHKAHA